MAESYMNREAALPYCKGCSHGVVLRALGEALVQLQVPPAELAIVTDIGCVGLADAQFATPHTVHTTHGRSTAFAAGIALADGTLGAGKMKTVVMIGDGGAMLGLNHLVNTALLNPDVTVLVHNNFLFGMTGGQNSAFTPLEFVTATTPAGSDVPPLDLAQLLVASRAPFVARKLATDRDLKEVIARAIAHPGFAVVEILELCTAYATRWNTLTGAQLKQVADRAGYTLGILREEPRATFAGHYREQAARLRAAAEERATRARAESGFSAEIVEPLGIVLAGTAGERVQSAATLLAEAGISAGLCVTQKNDNPVTQGSGFSVSEVMLSPGEILFTGIEEPDAILVVSGDGAKELERSGAFDRATESTVVIADADVALPELECQVLRFAFRKEAGGKLAAIAAVVHWVELTKALPIQAFWAALEARYGEEAATMRAKLAPFVVAV
jgi:2-oxoglutarate ferredoxin oxidoreductase subunit beta